uniref:Uncharacterized protein n=1 Tax=Lactuca sativa TaxID=4236 RepID=A0A9R1XCC2_LACSA|nr:hypothetical protein LSAT_V11C400198800 [Lactuca sativa]
MQGYDNYLVIQRSQAKPKPSHQFNSENPRNHPSALSHCLFLQRFLPTPASPTPISSLPVNTLVMEMDNMAKVVPLSISAHKVSNECFLGLMFNLLGGGYGNSEMSSAPQKPVEAFLFLSTLKPPFAVNR